MQCRRMPKCARPGCRQTDTVNVAFPSRQGRVSLDIRSCLKMRSNFLELKFNKDKKTIAFQIFSAQQTKNENYLEN